MHLVEISIFSINLVIVRPKLETEPSKIRHNFRKYLEYLKNQKFQKKFSIKVGLLVKYLHTIFFPERFNQFLTQKHYFESTNFEMFNEVVHKIGKSEDDMIYWKNAYFHMVSCPTWSKKFGRTLICTLINLTENIFISKKQEKIYMIMWQIKQMKSTAFSFWINIGIHE
jgi:hypothetical protein